MDTKSGIKVKSLAKLYTILLLNKRGMHGYEIMKEIKSKLGSESSTGQIYPFLKQLEKQRYVKFEGVGERDKKVYLMTPLGREFVADLSENFGNILELVIEQKLTTCAHCNCKIYNGDYKKKINGSYVDFCCRNCADAYSVKK
jgi:DNA-binding PadR family transcriptional regulator